MNTIVEILSYLVANRSLTADEAACRRALEWISKRPELTALEKAWFEKGGSHSLLLTTQKTKQPKVWLVAHIDVVEGNPGQFTVKKEEDRLIGRGTYDMLFAVAAFVQAVVLLGETVPDCDFGLMLTSDEETGGYNGVGALLEEGYSSKVAIVPDGGKDWQLITSVKGVYQVEICIKGVPAHGSRPWEGENPIPIILQKLGAIQEWFGATFPDPRNTTSCAITTLYAGTSTNRIPESATAQLDIRYSTKKELEKVKDFFQNQKIPMREIGFGSEIAITEDDPSVVLFKQVAKTLGISMQNAQQIGSNDGRYFAAKDITPIIFRPRGGGHHGDDEWVSLPDIEVMAKILAEYIARVA